jgi:hypothetical protein
MVSIMKHFIRPTGRTGRLASRLNRPFADAAKAKAALKEWLAEANRKRKKDGLDRLLVSDFKIIPIKPHPYSKAHM